MVDPEPGAADIYALLQRACVLLEKADDHAIAAIVSHGMALVEEKYGVGTDHLNSDGSLH